MKYLQNWIGCRFDPTGETKYECFAATVPGNIQKDYLDYKGVQNPMYSDTITMMEETEDWWWEYRTELNFDAESTDRVWFVAEGIDYTYDVVLDGKTLLSHEGMFSKTELDITDLVNNNSVLSVIIHPHPKREGNYIKMRELANQCCKPAVFYGWDFNPRLLISGIWRPAYIETRKQGHINNCEPFYTLNDTRDTATVHFETDCKQTVTYTVTDREGNIVYNGTNPDFCLQNIKLWWCNGQGEPYLYSWKAETADCVKTGVIGFRTIKLVKNIGTNNEPGEFPKTRYAAPITIELNGRRIFGKGSNLVNADIFPGNVEDERFEELIRLARDGHFNLFRIWGGGGLHKDVFYELCDRYGIMVWQEFMLACNYYRDTPHYMEILEQEAVAIIKHLRSHPCLAMWCGGNELFNGWSGMSDQDAALRLLNKLCYEYDLKTPFIMTSPLMGMAHGGYYFSNGKVEAAQQFQNAHNTAYTEFGVPSIADYEILKEIIPADELENMQPTKSWLYHHAYAVWGEYAWAYTNIIEKYFGKLESTKEIAEHSQWLQCEGYKSIFEEARRQWPYCSMALNWCMNEPWTTAANNSIISYPVRPKPAYYAVKNALSPVLASARMPKFSWKGNETLEIETWLLNDTVDEISTTVKVVVELGGVTYDLLDWNTGVVKGLNNKLGPTVHFQLPNGVDAKYLVVKCIAADGTSSEYKLQYKTTIPPVKTGQLNV